MLNGNHLYYLKTHTLYWKLDFVTFRYLLIACLTKKNMYPVDIKNNNKFMGAKKSVRNELIPDLSFFDSASEFFLIQLHLISLLWIHRCLAICEFSLLTCSLCYRHFVSSLFFFHCYGNILVLFVK